MPPILAIGRYAPTDAAALDDLGAQAIDRLADLDALPPSRRSDVRGVAYLGHDPFGPAQMDLLPSLRVIANFGVGHDAIDTAAANGESPYAASPLDVSAPQSWPITTARLSASSTRWMSTASDISAPTW